MQKPAANEHNPYFSRYISLVDDGEYINLLNTNTIETNKFFSQLPTDKHNYRYADGKWTVKEVLMHIMDTERVMSYRALVAARGDHASVLPLMDENHYADNVDVTNRTMEDLLEEFNAIRTATLKLFANITDEQSMRTANANGTPTTARAIAYVVIGHVIHHLNVLQERYL